MPATVTAVFRYTVHRSTNKPRRWTRFHETEQPAELGDTIGEQKATKEARSILRLTITAIVSTPSIRRSACQWPHYRIGLPTLTTQNLGIPRGQFSPWLRPDNGLEHSPTGFRTDNRILRHRSDKHC